MASMPKTRRMLKFRPFRAACKEVSQTDRNNRLPTISSAEVESIFEHALIRKKNRRQAA